MAKNELPAAAEPSLANLRKLVCAAKSMTAAMAKLQPREALGRVAVKLQVCDELIAGLEDEVADAAEGAALATPAQT